MTITTTELSQKLSQIAQSMAGELVGKDDIYTQLSSDTRTLNPGDVYIALKGDSFDGHDFIQQAIEKKAVCIIAQKNKVKATLSIPVIWVEDTTKALGLLAKYWRAQFDIPVIGITGSCGKTTVKSMLGHVLSLMGETLIPPGSFNNQFGLPFTLLQMNPAHKYAVIEVGTNHLGEIAYLANILQPTISLITNIRSAHLAGFKTKANIATEKGDLYKFLTKNGTAILNQDEPYYEQWLKSLQPEQRHLSFGLQAGDVTADNIQLSFEGAIFDLCYQEKRYSIKLNTTGKHSIYNALAVSCVALSLGVPMEVIVKGLENFQSVKGRLQRHQTASGVTIIDDSYNANPASFKAAIDVLASASGPKILVMGEMGELGKDEAKYHHEIGVLAKSKAIDTILSFGTLTQHTVSGFGEGAKEYQDKSILASDLSKILSKGTTVLIKGSRYTGMEDVLNALIN